MWLCMIVSAHFFPFLGQCGDQNIHTILASVALKLDILLNKTYVVSTHDMIKKHYENLCSKQNQSPLDKVRNQSFLLSR